MRQSKCFNFFRDKKRHSAYIIAITNQEFMLNMGAIVLDPIMNIYYVKRHYDGTPTGESCGLIGVPRQYISDLFNTHSKLYGILRTSPILKYIYGIETLSPYNLSHLQTIISIYTSMQKQPTQPQPQPQPQSITDNDIFLFNIEPKGINELANIYKTANICIPGGGIENNDDGDYCKCACREFKEETGIDITLNKHKMINIKTFIDRRRHKAYFVVHITSESTTKSIVNNACKHVPHLGGHKSE